VLIVSTPVEVLYPKDETPATDVVDAEVTRPLASITRIGTCDALPYVPAVTPVLASVKLVLGTVASSARLNDNCDNTLAFDID
jgi:hypothetical protein